MRACLTLSLNTNSRRFGSTQHFWVQNVRFGSNSGCHSGFGAHRRRLEIPVDSLDTEGLSVTQTAVLPA